MQESISFLKVLVKMLDVDVLSNEEERLQIISTLQSSPEGQKAYEALCEKLVYIFLTILNIFWGDSKWMACVFLV